MISIQNGIMSELEHFNGGKRMAPLGNGVRPANSTLLDEIESEVIR